MNYESKTERWIKKNRGIWIFILILTGLILGMGGSLLLGNNFRGSFLMGTIYSCLLFSIEISRGNE